MAGHFDWGDSDADARKKLISKIRRLPRYPYHTWDRKDDGNYQQLIGLDDVIALVARLGKETK